MAKKGGSQTVTTQNDPATQKMIEQIYAAAGQASNTPGAPIDPRVFEAGRFFSNATRTGNLGLGALGGDPSAMAAFMNPFLNEVISGAKGDFADINSQTMKSVDDVATKSGAFGGDRHGIATGTALAENGRTAQNMLSGLRYQGFNDAMGRAQGAANFGMGAAPGLMGIGDYIRTITEHNDPNRRKLDILREGIMGLPHGTSTTQPVNRNLGAGVLGGASAGAGIAQGLGASTPWGWAAAGLGGLLGLL
jgi:hypothetical protein